MFRARQKQHAPHHAEFGDEHGLDRHRLVNFHIRRRRSKSAERHVRKKPFTIPLSQVAGQSVCKSPMQFKQRRRQVGFQRDQSRRAALRQRDQPPRNQHERSNPCCGSADGFHDILKFARRRVANELQRQVDLIGGNGPVRRQRDPPHFIQHGLDGIQRRVDRHEQSQIGRRLGHQARCYTGSQDR